MFKSFMMDAMAKQMTRAGGIGLSGPVQQEMLTQRVARIQPMRHNDLAQRRQRGVSHGYAAAELWRKASDAR